MKIEYNTNSILGILATTRSTSQLKKFMTPGINSESCYSTVAKATIREAIELKNKKSKNKPKEINLFALSTSTYVDGSLIKTNLSIHCGFRFAVVSFTSGLYLCTGVLDIPVSKTLTL